MKVIESDLLDTFKSLLQEQCFGTQQQLARALSLRGFENITQTRISRLLQKVGAIKVRNHHNKIVYRLAEKHYIPRGQQAIDSVVLDVKHNNIQIIIKTVIGAATLIAKMIEDMCEDAGVLACMASDNTILVILSDVNKIEQTKANIIDYLGVS
ncbi:MAG: ArgR family transcriptional regulator [Litorilituus sp.]|jgi:transcriptional regulator of arginine metabolism|nr:ArgR family transcriptional regulator [Litorilituus sp.]